MEKSKQNSLGVSDNLELSNISIPEIPKNIIFPDDLNKYLRDQVQYLTHENGMLYKNISDLEVRLKDSTSKISSLSDEIEKTQSGTQNSQSNSENFACSKIVELSKQLRERNSEIETYKTKYAKLQKYVNEIEKDKKKVTETPAPQKPKNELEDQVKQLTEKLNAANNRLCEIRNSNTQLKSNLKLANKLILQEVGEPFENLQNIINTNGTWRGRSQIICDLQRKNSDLREKLKVLDDKDKVSVSQVESTHVTKWDKRLNSLTEENDELRNNAQEFKKKLDASRARMKVVESENMALRAKVSSYAEQADRDRETITSLTAKIARSHDFQNEAVCEKLIVIQQLEEAKKNLQLEVSKQACKITNLNAQLEEQKHAFESLRSKMKSRGKSSEIKGNQVNINQLDAERLRLLELTKITNDKLDLERTAHSSTQLRYLAERQKTAKLEAKVARLQLDKNTDRSSAYSVKSSLNLETYEDKLQLAEETIKALQTRLEVERQEHKNDVNEFTKILSNYHFDNTNKD